MSNYGYQYFAGANVVVELKNIPALECAGISYNINESKRPIYGYSSRFFDAVARGQVLVQGSLLVNYVHEDYVREILTKSKLGSLDIPASNTSSDAKAAQVLNSWGVPSTNQSLLNKIGEDWNQGQEVANALRRLYWPVDNTGKDKFNPHDVFGGFDIRITFGERLPTTGTGITGFLLENVYIVGRGKQIQISEDVIVEEFPFFARNSSPVYPEYEIVETPNQSEGALPGDTTSSVRTKANTIFNKR